MIPLRDPTSPPQPLQKLQGQGAPCALVAVDRAAQEDQVRAQQGLDLPAMGKSGACCKGLP